MRKENTKTSMKRSKEKNKRWKIKKEELDLWGRRMSINCIKKIEVKTFCGLSFIYNPHIQTHRYYTQVLLRQLFIKLFSIITHGVSFQDSVMNLTSTYKYAYLRGRDRESVPERERERGGGGGERESQRQTGSQINRERLEHDNRQTEKAASTKVGYEEIAYEGWRKKVCHFSKNQSSLCKTTGNEQVSH